jgi:E1-E2 ATPase
MTITKIRVAPYLRGPDLDPEPVKTSSPTNWIRRRIRPLGKDFRNTPESSGQPAIAAAPVVTPHWAYRAVNYRRLHAAGMPCVIAAPSIAAGISCHLELEAVAPSELQVGDVFLVETGQAIFADGLILEGIAIVDEAVVSGQSAPALRSADGDTAVMRDSHVIEGQILIEVAPRRGHPLDWIGEATVVQWPPAAAVARR